MIYNSKVRCAFVYWDLFIKFIKFINLLFIYLFNFIIKNYIYLKRLFKQLSYTVNYKVT